MKEKWSEIEEFPEYRVSNHGQVIRSWNGWELTYSMNQQGIPTVGPVVDGKQYRRSVPLLVANAFLPDPQNEAFDTPVQLDGDRLNCHVDNLVWRPRWFAIKYHQERRSEPFPNWISSFELIDTEEMYNHPRDCAVQYGLLEKDIFYSLMNDEKSIFPFGFRFRWFE